jgi:hypothetical protein
MSEATGSREVRGEWVVSTIQHATSCHPHEAMQMTILTRALTVAAKTLGISKEALLDTVALSYDAEKPMTLIGRKQ